MGLFRFGVLWRMSRAGRRSSCRERACRWHMAALLRVLCNGRVIWLAGSARRRMLKVSLSKATSHHIGLLRPYNLALGCSTHPVGGT